MTKKSYLEIVDKNLVLVENYNYIKPIDLLNIIRNELEIEDEMISIDKYLIRINRKNKIYFIYIDFLRPSGDKKNFNKRLHIRNIKKDFIFCSIAIGVYWSGNKNYFVYFSDSKILEKTSDKNKSIWTDFSYLYYSVTEEKDIKYLVKNKKSGLDYYVYISSNLKNIIDKKFENFINIEQKNEKKYFEDIYTQLFREINNNNNNNNNDKIEFDLDFFENIDNKIKKDSMNLEIGKIGELEFKELFSSRKKFLENILNIDTIFSFVWLNEESESYKPYDFVINGKVYVDVKATIDSNNHFFLSDNEINFMKSLSSDNSYFVANLINTNNKKKIKWFFYNRKELNNIKFQEKITRIYGE